MGRRPSAAAGRSNPLKGYRWSDRAHTLQLQTVEKGPDKTPGRWTSLSTDPVPTLTRTDPGAVGSGCGGRLRQDPALGVGAVAVEYLQLCAVCRAGTRIVQAAPGYRVEQRAVRLRLPRLRAAAVAGEDLDLRAVGRAGTGHVQTLAQRLYRAAGHGPALGHRPVAGEDLHWGVVRRACRSPRPTRRPADPTRSSSSSGRPPSRSR